MWPYPSSLPPVLVLICFFNHSLGNPHVYIWKAYLKGYCRKKEERNNPAKHAEGFNLSNVLKISYDTTVIIKWIIHWRVLSLLAGSSTFVFLSRTKDFRFWSRLHQAQNFHAQQTIITFTHKLICTTYAPNFMFNIRWWNDEELEPKFQGTFVYLRLCEFMCSAGGG